MFIGIVATFIIATIQARLLLSVQRSRSLSDSLIAQYHSESVIYGALTRFIDGYPVSDGSTTLDDGTELEITTNVTATEQMLTALAKRPFAVTKLVASRDVTETTLTSGLEMIVSFDCTGSMNFSATAGNVSAPVGSRRIDVAREALFDLLNVIETTAAPYPPGIFKIGINGYGVNSVNLQDLTSDIDVLRNTVNNEILISQNSGQTFCGGVINGTNIGIGFTSAYDYFDANPAPPNTKRAVVVITDGATNTRTPYAACPPSYFCPFDDDLCSNPEVIANGWSCAGDYGSDCRMPAFDYLKCALADTDTDPIGIRDPEVSGYLIKIANIFGPDETFIQDIGNHYATKFYNTDDASDLSDILTDVFEEVSEEAFRIRLRRENP